MVNKKTLSVGLKLIWIPFVLAIGISIGLGLIIGLFGSPEVGIAIGALASILLFSFAGFLMFAGGIVCIVGLCQDNK